MRERMRQGEIELKSGPWKWTVTELQGGTEPYGAGARPAGEADPDRPESSRTVLLLEDPMDPGHWMSRRLPSGAAEEDIPREKLGALARDPDRRKLVDSDGTVWMIERIGGPEAVRADADFERGSRKVTVSADGGQKRTLTLPADRPLGTVTSEELIRLVHD